MEIRGRAEETNVQCGVNGPTSDPVNGHVEICREQELGSKTRVSRREMIIN